MAIVSARCAVCNRYAYRNRHGLMLLHTRTAYDGLEAKPIVCEGSDRGARP